MFDHWEIAKTSDLAKLEGGNTQQLVDRLEFLLENTFMRFKELANIAQTCDCCDVVELDGLLKRSM